MYKGLNVYAVIAAAGRSRRMGTGRNKQFLMICGMPVLSRTLLSIAGCSLIDGIVVAASYDDMERCSGT